MQRLYKRFNTWCQYILDVLGLRSQPIQRKKIMKHGMKKKTKKAKKQAATAMSMKKAGKKPKKKMKY